MIWRLAFETGIAEVYSSYQFMQGESVQMTGHPVRSQPPASQWRWKQSLLPSAGLPQEVTAGPPDSVSLLQNGSAALDRRQ